MSCVLFFIICVHRWLILCATCYICLCLCLFSILCLLFGHVCISIRATKATGGSEQGHQCKILFLSSDGGIFVFLSKPRKQQEVVEPQCSSYWPVATAAFLRPQHFRTNSKANASMFAIFAWLAIFAIFAIFPIYPKLYLRYLQDLQYSNSQPFKTTLRFAINSIYLYSCDRLVWDSSGLTSSIQILPYQIIRCSIFVSCIYCEVSDDSLHHFLVFVCNWVWPWIS